MDNPRNPNPNFPLSSSSTENFDELIDSELLDYLIPDCSGIEEEYSSSHSILSLETVAVDTCQSGTGEISSRSKNSIKCEDEVKGNKKKRVPKIGFRTKSKMEGMDDGYRWRKYGKKTVKNTPYKRNYYKCISGGCHVKKRIERDRDDPDYVLTTYEGRHNHDIPSLANLHDMVPKNVWTLQASSLPASTSPP